MAPLSTTGIRMLLGLYVPVRFCFFSIPPLSCSWPFWLMLEVVDLPAVRVEVLLPSSLWLAAYFDRKKCWP